jgi:hypothetical protein
LLVLLVMLFRALCSCLGLAVWCFSHVGAGLGTSGGGLLAGQSFGEAALGGVTSGLMSFGMGSLLGGDPPGLTETTGGAAYGSAAQSAETIALAEVVFL